MADQDLGRTAEARALLGPIRGARRQDIALPGFLGRPPPSAGWIGPPNLIKIIYF